MKKIIDHGNLVDTYNYSAMIKNQSELGTQPIKPISKTSKVKTLKKVFKNSNYKRR